MQDDPVWFILWPYPNSCWSSARREVEVDPEEGRLHSGEASESSSGLRGLPWIGRSGQLLNRPEGSRVSEDYMFSNTSTSMFLSRLWVPFFHIRAWLCHSRSTLFGSLTFSGAWLLLWLSPGPYPQLHLPLGCERWEFLICWQETLWLSHLAFNR